MRLVIDTNVLISAVFRDRMPEQVLRTARDKHYTLLSSAELKRELRRVLNYPKFQRYYAQIGRSPDEVYEQYAGLTEMVTPNEEKPHSALRDASDQIVLACAAAGKADFIISGDDDLLTLGVYEQIRIVTPAQFLSIVSSQDETR